MMYGPPPDEPVHQGPGTYAKRGPAGPGKPEIYLWKPGDTCMFASREGVLKLQEEHDDLLGIVRRFHDEYDASFNTVDSERLQRAAHDFIAASRTFVRHGHGEEGE